MTVEVTEKKKSGGGGRRLALIIGIGVLACVGFIVAIIAIVFVFTQGAVNTANDFLGAMRDERYEDAVALMTIDLQDELGSASDFRVFINENNARPVEWSISSRERTNDVADLSGTVTLAGGNQRRLELTLVKENAGWRVARFFFNPF